MGKKTGFLAGCGCSGILLGIGGLFAVVVLIAAVANTGDLNRPGGGESPSSSSNIFSMPDAIVSKSEYSEIRNGMSYQEVAGIIGHEGEELSSNQIDGVQGVMPSVKTVMYSWANSDGSNMNAMFQNGKLMSKAQFGLK